MLYFAYGSNMDWFQMRERCPSARFVGVALLPDHELAFTRKSIKCNCGVADAIATKGQKLWGVLYEITEPDVARLDKSEGYAPGREKNSYFRRECVVWLDGNDRRPATASIYFGDSTPSLPLPNNEYKNLILSGAKYWRLPEAYVRELNAIEVDG